MGSEAVCDGTEFSCPFCTSKLKLKVPSSPAKGEKKPLANMSNAFFPPPGGQCTVIPSAPCPCAPAAQVIAPGQSPVKIAKQPALGAGCQFMCAKGGLITVSSPGQSPAKYETSGGVSVKDIAQAAVGALGSGGGSDKDEDEEKKEEEKSVEEKESTKLDDVFDKEQAGDFPKNNPKVDPPLFKDEADLKTKLTHHAEKERMVQRKVQLKEVMDAGNNPLQIKAPKVDSQGRSSAQFVGEKATISVNPEGKVTSCWPTSTKTAAKLKLK